jgi:hypothetical protein
MAEHVPPASKLVGLLASICDVSALFSFSGGAEARVTVEISLGSGLREPWSRRRNSSTDRTGLYAA